MVLQLNWILTIQQVIKRGHFIRFNVHIFLIIKIFYCTCTPDEAQICIINNLSWSFQFVGDFFMYILFLIRIFWIIFISWIKVKQICHQISSHIIRKAQSNSIHLKKQHYVMYILIVTAKIWKKNCLLKLSCFNINQN